MVYDLAVSVYVWCLHAEKVYIMEIIDSVDIPAFKIAGVILLPCLFQ